MIALATHETEAVPTTAAEPDWIVARAWERHEVLPVKRLDADRDPFLAAAMPDARNLLVAPMIADGRPVGAIVVEHRARGRRLPGVERRVASMVARFASMAALNLRNAVLLRHVQDLAERDALTGAANRRMFQLSLERTLEGRRAEGPRRQDHRDPVHRPRRLQGRQRHARPRGRRRAAGRGHRADLRPRPLDRPGGPARRRRVRDPDRGRAGPRALAGDGRAARPGAARAVRHRRSPGRRHLEHRHRERPRRGGRRDRPRPQRRRRDVHGQGQRQERLRHLRPGHARRDPRAERAERRAQARGRARPAPPRLPADHRPGDRALRGRRGARPLAASRARAHRPRPVHRDRRGERLDPVDRPLGPARDLRAGRALAARGPRPARRCSSASTSPPARSSSPASSTASATRSRRRGLEPTNLVLEITETALLKATPATIATLAELRALGVRTVIDDFGTGYFSLSHLRQFPIDILKIAGEFVQDADADPKSPALARAIVAMGRSMNMATVAEGIETARAGGQHARARLHLRPGLLLQLSRCPTRRSSRPSRRSRSRRLRRRPGDRSGRRGAPIRACASRHRLLRAERSAGVRAPSVSRPAGHRRTRHGPTDRRPRAARSRPR